MTEKPSADAYATRRPLGTEQLRALAHPLRFRILEVLREGPANSTVLAQRLSESTGATSYHLRQLARFGLIEEDESSSSARERWWRRREPMLLIDTAADDLDHAAEHVAIRATIFERDDEAVRALAANEQLLRSRPDTLLTGGWRVIATPDEIRALAEQVLEAVDALRRPRDETPDDATLTHITFRTIPLPTGPSSSAGDT